MKSVTLEKRIYALLWACVVFFSVYYIYANCLRYFVFAEKNYHFDFFWTRKYWLFIHILFGISATITSPFQFISYLRTHFLKTHKILGKIYVYSIIVSSITSFYLCATTPENLWYALGLGGFTFAWLITAVMGMLCAMKGKIDQHKAWMVRSFVVTAGFSISRLLEDMIVHADAAVARVERLTVLSWISWIIPLLITEWILIKKRNSIQVQAKTLSVLANQVTD